MNIIGGDFCKVCGGQKIAAWPDPNGRIDPMHGPVIIEQPCIGMWEPPQATSQLRIYCGQCGIQYIARKAV